MSEKYIVSVTFDSLEKAKKFVDVYSRCEPQLVFDLSPLPELDISKIDLSDFENVNPDLLKALKDGSFFRENEHPLNLKGIRYNDYIQEHFNE